MPLKPCERPVADAVSPPLTVGYGPGHGNWKMFHMCWALSDGSSKLIPIDEQPNHQIVHLFRLGKAQRATNQPLNPGPEIDVLALDFLRILLAHMVLLGIDMPLVGSPSVCVKLRDAKGL